MEHPKPLTVEQAKQISRRFSELATQNPNDFKVRVRENASRLFKDDPNRSQKLESSPAVTW